MWIVRPQARFLDLWQRKWKERRLTTTFSLGQRQGTKLYSFFLIFDSYLTVTRASLNISIQLKFWYYFSCVDFSVMCKQESWPWFERYSFEVSNSCVRPASLKLLSRSSNRKLAQPRSRVTESVKDIYSSDVQWWCLRWTYWCWSFSWRISSSDCPFTTAARRGSVSA